MDQLLCGYSPNADYRKHHAEARSKVSAAFKKSYHNMNDKIKILMNDLKKLQSGKQGYLKDKQTQKDVSTLCGQINQCFRDLKADFESNGLNKKDYMLSLNTLKVLIDTFPTLNKYGLADQIILGECFKMGVVK